MTEYKWHEEVAELHHFFQQWFRGEHPQTEQAFARFDGVLHPAFCIVPPTGHVMARAETLIGVKEGYGRSPNIKIWVEDVTLRYHTPHFLIVTYHELQETAASSTKRLSTVTFQPDRAQPNGLEWLHVHETWVT